MDKRIEILSHLAGILPGLEELASRVASCHLLDEKTLPANTVPTTAGDACRTAARAEYLIDVLLCEIGPGTSFKKCCTEANEDYCDAFERCPD